MNYKGFSLIELVIAIVILGIGVASFITLMVSASQASIDPLVRQQANAVAQAYLEEILLKPFCDPDLGVDCPTDCDGGNTCSDTTNCTQNTGGSETRATFDDVCDYDFPAFNNAAVTDQTGATPPPLDQLGNYRVTVDVIDDGGADLNGLDNTMSQILRIDVTVTHTTIPALDITLSGYRTNF